MGRYLKRGTVEQRRMFDSELVGSFWAVSVYIRLSCTKNPRSTACLRYDCLSFSQRYGSQLEMNQIKCQLTRSRRHNISIYYPPNGTTTNPDPTCWTSLGLLLLMLLLLLPLFRYFCFSIYKVGTQREKEHRKDKHFLINENSNN